MRIQVKNRKNNNTGSEMFERFAARQVNPELKKLLGAFFLSASSLVLVASLVSSATAEEVNSAVDDRPTVSDKIEDVFFTFDQTFYLNRRFPRNGLWFLGSFPENEIAGDGRVIHKLYNELIRQQNTRDPIIRTADLPNPFTSSLQSDAIFTPEPVPAATFAPSFRQSPAAPIPASTPVDSGTHTPTRETPIPALW